MDGFPIFIQLKRENCHMVDWMVYWFRSSRLLEKIATFSRQRADESRRNRRLPKKGGHFKMPVILLSKMIARDGKHNLYLHYVMIFYSLVTFV